MEADWDEIHRITVPPPPSAQELLTPASTLAFDNQQELLWIGNEYGLVTSFYGPELRRYTSFRAHPAGEGPVKQLLFHDRGVLSIAPTSVHLSSRRGFTQWHLAEERIRDLRCMSYLGKDSNFIVVAGCQDVMLKVDIEKGRIADVVPSTEEYMMMKFSKYICAATTTGAVNLLDLDNLRIVKTLSTNNVGICDMDARNNYLVTCGWVNRPQGTPMLAGLANVYDLRAMVQLPPVPFHAGAAHIQMHPKMSTTCILASQGGQLQVVDLMNSNTVNLRQANVSSYISGLVLAPSGEALAIADADGFVHLWGSPSKLQFSEFTSNPLEWGDAPEPLPFMQVDQDVPLSTIGMPFYREQLLSAWPSTQLYVVGDPPPKIDLKILQGARSNEIGVWAINPRKARRNQAEKTRLSESNGTSLAAPKFLSEKARDAEGYQSSNQDMSEIQEALANTALGNGLKSEVPVMYRNVEIKYSRFGVDDFDFEFYNRTQYSGLETHIANSYTNPILQLCKFTPLIRNLALHHTATLCLFETCLLCEMGFLFDTLEKAEGQNCQATNFLKAFSNIPQAGRLGLLEESSQGSTLSEMIQAASRFILTQTAEDYRRTPAQLGQFDQVLAVDALTSIRCVHCHNETIRPGDSYITDLVYPPLPSANQRQRNPIPTFSQVLKASVELQTQTRGWCDKCRRYQQLATRKSVQRIPEVFMINAALKSAEARQYYTIPGWLPDSIGVIVDNGKFFCFEGKDLQLHLQKGMHVVKVYDLVGIVADINCGEHQKPHLVSLINVNLSERDPDSELTWHLFNDFLVRRISKEEALSFQTSWKVPAVIAFQATTARHAVDDSWKANLDSTLLYRDWSINHRPPQNCRALDPDIERPGSGTYVAIDTEFVALQQEEIEIKADGDREVVRPTRLGLARVSVLRGSDASEGVPFINDYITIREDIVDYLTKWSGVERGDLDPQSSPHNLVPLKVAYKKLWLLLNLGCVFIGHGLPKDFRIINMHVPKAQVLDTVDLFFMKARQRKLSLRYLAWYLLKEDIQLDNHDSIEDARTALKLWRKYQELQAAGTVEATIEEIYREGKKWGYKPPSENINAPSSLMAGSGSAAASAAQAGTLGSGLTGGGSSVISRRDVRSGDSSTFLEVASSFGEGSNTGTQTPEVWQGTSGPGTPLLKRSGLATAVVAAAPTGPGKTGDYFDNSATI